jgi:hypothetical protein
MIPVTAGEPPSALIARDKERTGLRNVLAQLPAVQASETSHVARKPREGERLGKQTAIFEVYSRRTANIAVFLALLVFTQTSSLKRVVIQQLPRVASANYAPLAEIERIAPCA